MNGQAPGDQGGAPSQPSAAQFQAAFEVAFPVYEMAKLRHKALIERSDPGWTGLNAFWHQDALATAEDRWVTTPNIDTLYSVAWVDLSRGPVRLTIPPRRRSLPEPGLARCVHQQLRLPEPA